MSIRAAAPAETAVLFRAYSNATAPLVHGFAATEAEFHSALASTPRHLGAWETLADERRGGGVGFIRVGVFRPLTDRWSFAKAGDGLILGPFVPRGSREAAANLLDAACSWLRERGVIRCLGFDPVDAASLPFYNGGWCGLSERMPEALSAYARAGFRIEHRELCMTRPDLPAPAPVEPPGRVALVDERRNSDRGRNAVRLWDRGALVGACYYSPMYPARSGRPQARYAGYIDGLSVTESYRGRGYGRMLLSAALHRLREMDCLAVSLTTSAANLRAQNLYYSLDFALTDSCVTLAGPVGARELATR